MIIFMFIVQAVRRNTLDLGPPKEYMKFAAEI